MNIFRKGFVLPALLMLVVCLRVGAGDAALDAKVNAFSAWLSAGHAWGDSVFTMSAITPETDPVHGQVMRSDITATPTTDGTLNYGYAELRWTSPDTTIDLNDYARMDFWYKIEVSSGAINNNAWCTMTKPGWNGSVNLPGVTWTVDGQWHRMEWPLRPADMTNGKGEWTWNAAVFTICFGVPPAQSPGQKLAVNFHFGGFHFVSKPKTPAYLLMYDRYGGSTWPNFAPDPKVASILEKTGFSAAITEYAASPSLTMDYLKQFNLVVFAPHGSNGNSAINILLRDYVRQGGGLLILGNWNNVGAPANNTNDLLAPLGVNILSEQVFEDTGRIILPAGVVGWTDNIAADPVTAGVKGLFYPVSYHVGWDDWTSPVSFTGNDWRTLISGRSTAYSMVTTKNGSIPPPPAAGTYRSAPPLLAVRDFGAGRVAVLPLFPSCIWTDAYHYVWGSGLMMEGGKEGMRGDGARLIRNLFAYLSAPSRNIFGGWIPPKTNPRADVTPIDWAKVRLTGCQQPNNYVGLIGAQSSLSVGTSTPREMMDAARQAGYNFIAFTEELSSLTPEEFNTLKDVCAANSDGNFQAYPGYKYIDESGNSWVTFSNLLKYPNSDWFSAKHPGRLKQNNPICRTFNWPPTILLSSNSNPEKPWFQGGFHGFSVYTYRNGTLADDSRDNYAKMNKMGFNVFPAAVHIVTSAEQVSRTRNLGYQTNVRWADNNAAGALRGAWGGDDATGYWFSQASEGPLVEDFRIYYDSRLEREGADRLRIHLLASSSVGLSEVCIYDGDNTTPWRRFKPGGTKTFEETIDCFHDRQHYFFMALTDTDGRKSVGWSIPTSVTVNNFARCADNMNTMPSGIYQAIPENMLNTRGMETASASRGWARYYYAYADAGHTDTEDIGGNGSPAIEYYPALACRFGIILDTIADYHYSPPNAWDQTDLPAPAIKNTHVRGNVRYTLFTPRYDSTLADIVEGEWLALADKVNFGAFAVFQYGGPMDPPARYCATRDGGILDAPVPLNSYLDGGPLPLYGLIGEYPAGRTGSFGAVALEDGTLTYSLTPAASGTCGLYLKKQNGVISSGDTFRYKYLAVHSRLGPAPDNSFITGLHNTMGLDGTPSYAITPTVGSEGDTHYIARLNAAGYGFSATVQTETDLPIDLPVLITGLNPNWDAGIWYRGTNTLRIPCWTYNEYGQPLGAYRDRTETDQILRIPILSDGANIGTGLLQIDGALGTKDIYIGNLLVSDNQNIVLTLTDAQNKSFVAHNPTDSPITCTVQPGPGFTLLGNFQQKITVPAGSSATIHIK